MFNRFNMTCVGISSYIGFAQPYRSVENMRQAQPMEIPNAHSNKSFDIM